MKRENFAKRSQIKTTTSWREKQRKNQIDLKDEKNATEKKGNARKQAENYIPGKLHDIVGGAHQHWAWYCLLTNSIIHTLDNLEIGRGWLSRN